MFFFSLFFSIILTCSLLILLSSNPIHSVLFLVLLFCNTAALLLLFGIEFLSIMLIIIYVGAIAILFLFVVMMLDIKILQNKKESNFIYFFFSFFILTTFFMETFLSTIEIFNKNLIGPTFEITYSQWVSYLMPITNTETIGQVLYTFYLAFFLIAGIILLIALIGAVMLTFTPKKFLIDIYTTKQISRFKNNAIFNIY